MSAPHQPPHPSFTFLPQLPAPTNPNPNPPPPPPDLPTTISTLHTLLSSTEDTITSISKFFSLKTLELNEDEDDSVACPFDPRHRTPPESVFHHSLRCPSSPPLPLDVDLDLDLLFASLRYPKTLQSQAELARDNRFVGVPPDSDLCFSINTDYEENPCFSSGFFYRDCPGVVTFAGTSLRYSSTDDRTFVIPATLSGECSNFSDGLGDSPERRVGILPSELWALRREMGAWADYPVSYSYVVLRVASCLRWSRTSGLRRWVILNSLRYGVLIDPAMRDHIFLLLNLCLRVIWREAFCSLEVVCGRDLSAGDGYVDLKGLRFECPQLVTALVWFTLQMDVLYGESNGKFFVIDIFKQSLFQAGSDALLDPLAEKTRAWTLEEVDVGRKSSGDVDSKFSGMILEGSSEHPSIKGKNLCEDEIVGSSQVFVSQVAAAVAALHERSFLEQQIKELHFAQPLPKSQLINDYSYITLKANEERGKCSNYRAILEHDGLVWQQPRNQGPNTFKTREEQLAAERDYKRRRMSYRGKKVKRTQIDVLRDIIEEHMEEIKQAGGIGCFVKGATGTGMFLPESTFGSNLKSTFYGLKNSGHESSEVERKDSHVDGKMLYGRCDVMSVMPDDFLCQDRSSLNNGFENAHQQGDDFHSPRGGQGRTSKYGQHIEHESRSTLSYQSHSHSHWPYDKKERHSMETTMVRRDRSVSSHRSMYQNLRSSSTSNQVNDCNKGNFDQRLENKSRQRRRNEVHKSGHSDSEHSFEDRYNPGSFEKYKDTR